MLNSSELNVTNSCYSNVSLHLKTPHVVIVLIMCLLHLQVGHVQQVSLSPDRTHQMKTISLKPLLFGKCSVVFGCDLLCVNKWHSIGI